MQAAVNELQLKGVKCSLLTDAKPRMYYKDQMQRHLGQASEVCPLVLHLDDCAYDVAFIQAEDGALTPVFDDWVPSSGGKAIKAVLGAAYKGKVEHWSGNRAETEQTLHSIGRLLQGYSKYTAIESATADGFIIESCTEDELGNIQLRLTNC